MVKIVVVIDNGYSYSDYGVYGAVLLNKQDLPLLKELITQCETENYAERKAYNETHDNIVKYPIDIEVRFERLIKEHGMKFFSDFITLGGY